MFSRTGKPQPRDAVAINYQTRSNYINLDPDEKPLQRYPSLDWTSDDFAMTYRLLEALEQCDELCLTVFTPGRKSVTGMTKSDAYLEIAVRVLEAFPAYASYVGDAAGYGAKHYGPCIRNKIFAFQAQYNSAREFLGFARTGLPAEWKDGEAWDSVKQSCPYLLRLGALVEKCTNVGDPLIEKRNGKVRGVDLTGNGEIIGTRQSGKPDDTANGDDKENEDAASSDTTRAHDNGLPDDTRARESGIPPYMEDDDDEDYDDGVSSDSTSDPRPRRNRNVAAPRRSLVDQRLQNVDNSVVAAPLNSPPTVVNSTSTPRTRTNAQSPPNAVENRTRSAETLKRKAAVGALGNGPSTVPKPTKRRRRGRDENAETSKGESRSGVRQPLGPDAWYDLRVAELQERRARRKVAEKRADREYQLQMRRLELLGRCISSPANQLPAASADDKKEKPTAVSPNATRRAPGQQEEGTAEPGAETEEEAESSGDDMYSTLLRSAI